MKKFLVFLMAICLILTSCADSKTFQKKNGETFTAEPYGWFNKENKIPGVEYELSKPNLVLDVVFSGSLVIPVVLTGIQLYEPVNYIENEDSIR